MHETVSLLLSIINIFRLKLKVCLLYSIFEPIREVSHKVCHQTDRLHCEVYYHGIQTIQQVLVSKVLIILALVILKIDIVLMLMML